MRLRPAAVRLTALFIGFLASTPASFSAPQAPAVFRSGIDVVQLDVSVMRDGRPVPGLTAADFELTDNGAEQEVSTAEVSELPLDVTLALDVSASVLGEKLENLIAAGDALTRALRPADRAALLTFSHDVRLRVPFTADMTVIRTALGRVEGSGATALRDAVALAIASRPAGSTRSLLLLFSDGMDTASWLTQDEVLDVVRRAPIVIHPVRLERDRFLDQLAEASGGRTWSALSERDLRVLFTRALEEMRARYLLTYSPRTQEPGWHEIKVRLRDGRGEVTARPGYFVSSRRSP